ncbi:MAG: 50S ribosome-binding GTPase, partial [Phycisphaeraceae bacterium]|nr:50S ribosome-binding GTPase [Phycisphaeraceae bacterium]
LTAPDGADINLHGGPWVVRSVLDLCAAAGFTIEARADLSDGGDSLERQMLAAIPSARTELALRALLAQPDAWAALRDEVLRDDVVRWDDDRRRARLGAILADRALENLLRLPQVAIVGPPNVGKSTLANQLVAAERSITADLPGTTRDWVGEVADIDGLAVLLVDTPGLRCTDDAVERQAIAHSAVKIGGSDLLLLVLDGTRPLAGEQQALLDRFPGAARLVNKMDVGRALDPSVLRALPIAARLGAGLDAVRRMILRHFGCWEIDPTLPRCWTDRQRALVQSALDDPTHLSRLWSR